MIFVSYMLTQLLKQIQWYMISQIVKLAKRFWEEHQQFLMI